MTDWPNKLALPLGFKPDYESAFTMTLGHFLSSEYDDIVPLAGGSGGQGTVFKARHREFGQLRAVKWLHGTIESSLDDSNQPNKTNRLYQVFIREARNLMQLNTAYHPNIVRIYNARLIQHQAMWFPILEMELIEGTDLNTLIEQAQPGGLPISVVETLVSQLASALAYCHMLNVIHRDIKSPNVMQDSQAGKFVLVDYGLSLLAGEPVSQERRGTPQYMSPEQYEGLDPSYQSDIYSVGVVLYEALTGQLPFGPQPSSDLWRFYSQSHLHAPVVPIVSLRTDVPTWLEEVVLICLAKDPRARFANGQALVNHLTSRGIPPESFSSQPVAGLTLPGPEWAARKQPGPATNQPIDVPRVAPSMPPPNPQAAPRYEPPPVTRPKPPAKPGRGSRRLIGIGLLLLSMAAGAYWLLSSGSVGEDIKQARALEQDGQYSQAAAIYQRLIDQGDPSAYKPLFTLYMEGHIDEEQRCRKAFDLLRAAADADDYQACNVLGYVYEYGEYINRETGQVICQYEPNAGLAFQYVQKAAMAGNVEAMRQLATYYGRGFGTAVDEQQAAYWRQKEL